MPFIALKKSTFEEGDTVEYEMKLLLTEVKNDIEWKFYKQKPDAVIESKYIFP